MSAQNLNFAPKFFNVKYLAPNFVFLNKYFSTARKLSD